MVGPEENLGAHFANSLLFALFRVIVDYVKVQSALHDMLEVAVFALVSVEGLCEDVVGLELVAGNHFQFFAEEVHLWANVAPVLFLDSMHTVNVSPQGRTAWEL